jgi:hypothetical protein
MSVLSVLATACSEPQRVASAPSPVAPTTVDACETLPVLAHVVGQRYELVLHETTDETLYTVKDAAGSLLVACASFDVLRRDHPELYEYVRDVIIHRRGPQMGYVP